MSHTKLTAGLVLGISAVSFAGARIDLRPAGLTVNPGNPPTLVASPGQNVHFDVYIVDTGNPQGNISFRGLFLSFLDSDPAIAYPGTDGTLGTTDDNKFNWVNPSGLGVALPNLPFPGWVFPGPANPALQITMPNDGEVRIGDVSVRVPDTLPALLDVLSASHSNPTDNGSAVFGFDTPGDPSVNWQAHNGDLTGGQLLIVPEPTAVVLMALSAATMRAIRRRR